jgi:hypothetical protein
MPPAKRVMMMARLCMPLCNAVLRSKSMPQRLQFAPRYNSARSSDDVRFNNRSILQARLSDIDLREPKPSNKSKQLEQRAIAIVNYMPHTHGGRV